MESPQSKQETTKDFTGMYQVRDYKPEDFKFIMATFLRGLYYGDSWFSEIPSAVFMENYKRVGEALIAHPSTIIKVACLKDDEDVILGYSILGDNYLKIHWVFVKAAWRKGGIGRSLTPKNPNKVTHLTHLGKILLSKLNGAIFDPFSI